MRGPKSFRDDHKLYRTVFVFVIRELYEKLKENKRVAYLAKDIVNRAITAST